MMSKFPMDRNLWDCTHAERCGRHLEDNVCRFLNLWIRAILDGNLEQDVRERKLECQINWCLYLVFSLEHHRSHSLWGCHGDSIQADRSVYWRK